MSNMFLCLKKKKTMKVIDIYNIYKHLNNAKLNKMEDKDKFTVIRAMRQLKPIYKELQDAIDDASIKCKPDDWDEQTRRRQEFDQAHGTKRLNELTLGEMNEREAIVEYITKYNKDVDECVRDLANQDRETTYTRLTEEAFGKLLESNPDWTMQQILAVADVLEEEGKEA